ncbi:sterol desaturase family protein [Emticicia sp. C21]|uniref:sterol desaturase family protein n=1 Tax=Emticicia sp. C21 TaxID=2302915 RepID=UPI000E350A3C|nr:sterol desaturase family protein [Emticicia sp. C21]RFS16216.1 beta-carotene hydroxylase [Emticicia sp. C21]
MFLIKALIVLGTFCFMEFMAWFAHKYIMHGFGWNWHKDHHQHHKGFFEKNDYYAVVFSIVAASSIIYGNINSDFWYLTWIGAGVTCYGVAYFVFHDIIVHRRVKIKFVAKSKYMKRIMNAHYIHHRVHTKDGAEAFGFLYAPEKYEPKKRE